MRHKDVHYWLIAEAIAALVPGRDARVLDYGCGEALHADRVAAMASEVLLCEAASRVRAGIDVRFAKNAKIRAVAPDEVERLPEHSLDLTALHSVAQYLEPEDTAALFVEFHRLLKFDGLLVVSDILSPHVGALTDASALLRFAAPNGISHRRRCRVRAHAVSDYWRIRTRFGLTQYDEAAILGKAEIRRIYGTPCRQKHRPQPGTHGILCATALRTMHMGFVACDTGSAQLRVAAGVR